MEAGALFFNGQVAELVNAILAREIEKPAKHSIAVKAQINSLGFLFATLQHFISLLILF